jgi:hypothetical protein
MKALKTTWILGMLLTVGVGRAVADSECMQAAKDQRQECRTSCDEDFSIARDLCRNIDPECAAGCRVDLDGCRAPIVAALEQCVDQCRVQLNADRAACPRRGRARDLCVDHAQVRAFLCRDECRQGLQVRDALNACRQAFGTCMNGCGISPEPTPVATATAVKTEAPAPTPVKTEAPQPTDVPQPTEPPPPPTATRTATPKPQPTQTPVGPR